MLFNATDRPYAGGTNPSDLDPFETPEGHISPTADEEAAAYDADWFAHSVIKAWPWRPSDPPDLTATYEAADGIGIEFRDTVVAGDAEILTEFRRATIAAYSPSGGFALMTKTDATNLVFWNNRVQRITRFLNVDRVIRLGLGIS
jgi:hypothetical protein